MEKYISDRVINEANYIATTNKTIREVAGVFGVSKSTVHNDVRKRLFVIDKNLYDKVSSIFNYHIDIKHLRGGAATKRKFLEENSNRTIKKR